MNSLKYIVTTVTLFFQILISAQEPVIIGPGKPPEGWNPERKSPVNVKKLTKTKSRGGEDIKILDVPAYDWTYGCSPTSAGMLIAYYDRNGYPNLYTGDDNYGVAPMTNKIWDKDSETSGSGECPFIASTDHIKDFWVESGSGEDPFFDSGTETRNWTPHWDPTNTGWETGDCLADFMGTSQRWLAGYDSAGYLRDSLGNSDGGSILHSIWEDLSLPCKSTKFGDLTYGCVQYIKSKGYLVDNWFNQANSPRYENGFTFDKYCEEIDSGRPVMVIVTGHNMLGIGYNKSENKIYIHNAWDFTIDEMEWNGKYHDRQMLDLCIIHLAPPTDHTEKLSICSSSETAGTVYPSGTIYSVASQKIKAVPEHGYSFSYWSSAHGNVTFTDTNSSETTITVSGEDTVTAVFEELTKYTVTYKIPDEKYGNIAYYEADTDCWNWVDGVEYTQKVYSGEDCRPVKVTQGFADYPFKVWTGDITSSDNPITITKVTENITVTAMYGTVYTITAGSTAGGGTDHTIFSVMEGETATITAVPETGFRFTGWTGDVNSSDNPLDITDINRDYSVTANFEGITYTVTISASGAGSLSETGTKTVNYGDSLTVTAIPDEYYKFAGWTGSVTSEENQLYISEITSNLVITANFEPDKDLLTILPGEVSKYRIKISSDNKGRDKLFLKIAYNGDITTISGNMTVTVGNQTLTLDRELWHKNKYNDSGIKVSVRNGFMIVSYKGDLEPLDFNNAEISVLTAPEYRSFALTDARRKLSWSTGKTESGNITVKKFKAIEKPVKNGYMTAITMTGEGLTDPGDAVTLIINDSSFSFSADAGSSGKSTVYRMADSKSSFVYKENGSFKLRMKIDESVLDPDSGDITMKINDTEVIISTVLKETLLLK